MLAIAATPGSSTPVLIEHPQPASPGRGEVLCQTVELGVCGTDREILSSLAPAVPKNQNYLILGHECLARVEEVGEGVDTFRPGDLVVPLVRRPLRESAIRTDMLGLGDFTERGIFDEHGFGRPLWLDQACYLLPVTPQLAPYAVLTEPLSIVEKGINESLIVQRARLGEQAWQDPPPRVLVTGMGPIGFSGLLACVCRKWPVTLYGRDSQESSRVSLANQLDATYTTTLSPKGAGRSGEPVEFDLILECTGNEQVMLNAAQSLAPRGVMVWLGSSRRPQPSEVNLGALLRDSLLANHVFIGSVNSAPRDFHDALKDLAQLADTNRPALDQIFTDRVSPEDAVWHYQNRRKHGIKTVVHYDSGAHQS